MKIMYTNRLLNEFYPKITQGTGARAPVSVHAALDSPSPATIGSFVPVPLVDQVQPRSKGKAWVKMKITPDEPVASGSGMGDARV